MNSYSEFISQSLQNASRIANHHYGKIQGTSKGNDNNQVLTEADIEIGKTLIELVEKSYPSYNIIDEEAGVINKNSDYTWVIDPIDGTSNFANNVPTYGVMIGLLEKNMPLAGGVVLPYFSELYTAEKGMGAFCNSKPIQISKEENLLSSLVAYGIDGHQENPSITHEEARIVGELALNVRNLRTSHSAFDYMMVAKGSYGAMLDKTTKIWDNVAIQIIIEEAGGKYTDYYGNPMIYDDPLSRVSQNYTLCAGSPALHKQIQNIISKLNK